MIVSSNDCVVPSLKLLSSKSLLVFPHVVLLAPFEGMFFSRLTIINFVVALTRSSSSTRGCFRGCCCRRLLKFVPDL